MQVLKYAIDKTYQTGNIRGMQVLKYASMQMKKGIKVLKY